MTTSKLRIYELCNGPTGPSCQSKYYGKGNKVLWLVAAVSIKQAYYLAGNNIWRENGQGSGIVQHTSNGAETQWTDEHGNKSCDRHYKHGQKLKE